MALLRTMGGHHERMARAILTRACDAFHEAEQKPIGVVPYGRRAVCAEYVELYGYFAVSHHLPGPLTVCGSPCRGVCRSGRWW
jgi:hypothetical protein